jgi:hypothetical protein
MLWFCVCVGGCLDSKLGQLEPGSELLEALQVSVMYTC